MTEKALHERMVDIANRDQLPEDHEMRLKAAEFADACDMLSNEQREFKPKVFLGRYARAKRAISNYTGEPLI